MDDENEMSASELFNNMPLALMSHKEGRILEAAYEIFKSDKNLTDEDISKLEEIAVFLKTAAIKIDNSSCDAEITTDDKYQKNKTVIFDEKLPKFRSGTTSSFSEDDNNLNQHGEILIEAYKAFRFSEDHLSSEQLVKLKQIDEVLECADIIVNCDSKDAVITTDEGEFKKVLYEDGFYKPSGGRGGK